MSARGAIVLTLAWLCWIISASEPVTDQEDSCARNGTCEGKKDSKSPMVSVLTPTRERTQNRLPLLFACWKHQTYVNRELLVIDDSPSPSPFFASLQGEPMVTYIHLKTAVPLGKKRNMLSNAANGTILVHFDDDDWYGPLYIERMVYELRRNKASLVKLSGWYIYSCKLDFFGYYDPAESAIFGEVSSAGGGGGGGGGGGEEMRLKYSLFLDPRDPIVQTWVMGPGAGYDTALRDETRFGFGFSYVYKKRLSKRHPYNDSQTFGEDLNFITRVIKSGSKVIHFADREALAMHVQGDWNTARIPTQYRLPAFLVPVLFGPAAAAYTRCIPPAAGPGDAAAAAAAAAASEAAHRTT